MVGVREAVEDEGGQVAEGGLGEVQLVEERVRQQGPNDRVEAEAAGRGQLDLGVREAADIGGGVEAGARAPGEVGEGG